MVVEVYGGPNSVRVTNSFSIGFKDYQVTSRKIIHCQIDGRGSGNKGKQLLFTINNRMGTVEIEDQIAVAKYLQQKYRFIDESRTGIWGWSYGGYATAMALSTDSEHVFKCGVSVAPVSAWIYYDSIYTERYMGLPTDDDNIINYNATDVTQHINELENHELLLMHGNADDNVHFQQAMALTRALVAADVQFEQAVRTMSSICGILRVASKSNRNFYYFFRAIRTRRIVYLESPGMCIILLTNSGPVVSILIAKKCVLPCTFCIREF